MGKISFSVLFVLFFGAFAGADIIYLSPTTSGGSISPQSNQSFSGSIDISVQASSSSGYAITAWHTYVDNLLADSLTSNAVYEGTVNCGDPLKDSTGAQVGTVKAGTHAVIVRAWDSAGTSASFTATGVQLTCGSTTTSGSLPTPPSTATVISNIDALTSWHAYTGSTAACPGGQTCPGGSNIAKYANEAYVGNSTYGLSTVSGSDGKSAMFALLSGSDPYSNLLYTRGLGSHDNMKTLLWDYRLYVKSRSATALEYDLVQVVNYQRYMIATQCDYASGTYDVFDGYNSHWIHVVPTADNNYLKCPKWSVNTWHHVTWYFYRNTSTLTYGYRGVEIDGVYHNLLNSWGTNSTGSKIYLQSFKTKSVSWQSSLGVQIQIDADKYGTPFSEWIDLMKITGW